MNPMNEYWILFPPGQRERARTSLKSIPLEMAIVRIKSADPINPNT